MTKLKRLCLGAIALAAMAGCEYTVPLSDDLLIESAQVMTATQTGLKLERLPPPARQLDVGVYAFPDLTGQNEPVDEYAELSRAVTQGGADILTDVLKSAGGGQWFNVIERARVDNLLRERAIIEQTQAAFTGGVSLPPLRFAGTLVEGSIVGYDTNTVTGGVGARFLGVGSFSQYRKDIVTVALRAVSVSTGRVLTSVTTTKTVYSVQVQGDVFQYVSVDEILEYETGFTRNEPEIFAVREAMELAVMAMIVEGAESGQWAFKTETAGREVISDYRTRYELARLGYSPAQISQFMKAEKSDTGVIARN
ncbi:curli production assembly/transport component CsgG [Roseivivax lentus]|uniref:Curli production assembly/transport component CsgG n=1 Tax=Roseivivax lentus TaxID=633194 RepID=A0A1N7N9S6_9RHOB|nr:CsgG/HfaB family protein [Roseivivax lentus]SIS95137.1 curli production assembly/transport component CsgG [Roseivivax lentus]